MILLQCSACSSFKSARSPATSAPFDLEKTGVFSSYEPLNIEIEAPLAELFAQKDDVEYPANKNLFTTGSLSYQDQSKNTHRISVKIYLKGFSTLSNCPFPKLELKMNSQDVKGTLFSSMDSIDLNTHCTEEKDTRLEDRFKASVNNHREALIYRMAHTLEIPTLQARPVFVRYKKTKIPVVDQNPKAYQAFFLEDMSHLRRRLNGKEVKGIETLFKNAEIAANPKKASQYRFKDIQSSPQVDVEDVTRIALFQAMIGNGDWFIKVDAEHGGAGSNKIRLWNIKILELPTGKWVLFPQDFGISYPLMGDSLTDLEPTIFGAAGEASQKKLIRVFLNKKTELYQLLETLKNDPQGAENFQKTLDHFYQNLEPMS